MRRLPKSIRSAPAAEAATVPTSETAVGDGPSLALWCGSRQLDLASKVVRKQQPDAPHVHRLAPAAHLAAQLCDELLRASKEGRGGGAPARALTPARDALWTRAVINTAERALSHGLGRDQPALTLAAALTLFNFERHTPKTAPSAKQVRGRPEAGVRQA